jgi:hypothetical protein
VVSDPVVGLDGTVGDAESPPDQERSSAHQRDPDGRPEPEQGDGNPPLWAEHPYKPDRGERHLDRQEDEAVATSGTLIAAGKSSRNGGLVGIGDTFAPTDGLTNTSPGVGVQAILEGESPLWIAALPNLIVHGCCCTPGWFCRPRPARPYRLTRARVHQPRTC